MIEGIVAVVGFGLVAWLAVVLIKFNRKRLLIIRCAGAAKEEQLEAIYSMIDRLGAEPPSCAVLARTNRTILPSKTEANVIPIPDFLKPWDLHTISIQGGKDLQFVLSPGRQSAAVIRGRIYRLVPIPRFKTKAGKTRNQFAPERYVAGDPSLRNALTAICPDYPTDLLSYLLQSGAETFEFDPINQVRLGGIPSWVQDPDFPRCDECNRRMSLILQLPGTLLPGKPLPAGTFFFFGCAKHTESTKLVSQFT